AGSSPDGTLNGVAKDAGIIAVNIFSSFSPEECDSDDPCVMSLTSDQISGLLYIYSLRSSYNIGAVNMSLGGGRYEDYCDEEDNYPSFLALDLLREAGIPTSIASGNETFCGNVSSPACISAGITVMASTRTDMEVKFSNWHSEVGDIFAPGQKIVSAVDSGDSDYEKWSGTSMAAPHVAGAMTLMRQVRPLDSPKEILSRLTERGKSITTPCPDSGSQNRLFVDNFHSTREKAEMLFSKLESQYPEILYPLPATTQVEDGYIYRHYSGKNVYLATYQENAFFVDEHGNIVELGSVEDLVYFL
ncbi:MAG: S8 family serine peptidase, partial [Desulfonatronovibrio sp.]